MEYLKELHGIQKETKMERPEKMSISYIFVTLF